MLAQDKLLTDSTYAGMKICVDEFGPKIQETRKYYISKVYIGGQSQATTRIKGPT